MVPQHQLHAEEVGTWLENGDAERWNDARSCQESKYGPSMRYVIGQTQCTNLVGFNLSHFELPRPLEHFDLRNANLSGSIMGHSTVRECTLIGAKLHKADLNHTTFENVNLSRAELIGATATNATFLNSDLSNANVELANLDSCDLDGSILIGVRGLFGPYAASMKNIKNAHRATYARPHDFAPWHKIRSVGKLPFLGVSYSSLALIFFIASMKDTANHWILVVKRLPYIESLNYVAQFPLLKVSVLRLWDLIALIFVAIASTIYAFLCPAEISRFSLVEWDVTSGRAHCEYMSLSYSKGGWRYTCAALYAVGGSYLACRFLERLFVAGWSLATN